MQNPKFEELKCSKCGIVFSKPKQLRKHMKTHGEGSYECHECGKCFLELTGLQGHIGSDHTGVRQHMCTECDKTFVWGSQLREHLKTHFQCSVCNKALGSSKDLQMHMESHKGPEKIKYCSECDVTFPKHHLYLQHMKKKAHFKELSSTQIHCSECGMTFNKENQCRDHMIKKHGGKGSFQCSQCGKAFMEKQQLSDHMKDHSHKCSQCDKIFSNSENLKQHIKTHSDAQLLNPETTSKFPKITFP